MSHTNIRTLHHQAKLLRKNSRNQSTWHNSFSASRVYDINKRTYQQRMLFVPLARPDAGTLINFSRKCYLIRRHQPH